MAIFVVQPPFTDIIWEDRSNSEHFTIEKSVVPVIGMSVRNT